MIIVFLKHFSIPGSELHRPSDTENKDTYVFVYLWYLEMYVYIVYICVYVCELLQKVVGKA